MSRSVLRLPIENEYLGMRDHLLDLGWPGARLDELETTRG